MITVTNTAVPTVLALYEGANLGQSIACAQGATVVLPSAKAKRLYWLAFGSQTDTGGPIQFVFTAGVPPPFQHFEPTNAVVQPDSTIRLVAPGFSEVNPPPTYIWLRDGKPIEGIASAELMTSCSRSVECGWSRYFSATTSSRCSRASSEIPPSGSPTESRS